MLTAGRPYDALYRRSGQAMHPMLHEQLIPDTYSSQYSSKRNTPELDLEAKASVSHRKRVPVACDRCRKRKIKCSGDQGDGTSCDNCKSAGWDGCQFLRVRSSLLDCHPTISTGRSWHSQHYHPYSRGRNIPAVQQANTYVQSTPLPYSTWSNGVDYSGLHATNALPWNHSNHASAYSLYESDHGASYVTQPPSYMLPDHEHATRPNASYMSAMPRTPQSSMWLDQLHSASVSQQNTQMSPVYPLTPADSTKSYSMFGTHVGQHTLSNERIMSLGRAHTPILATALPSIPSQERDTPPLSAVSHRSSHTWNTDTASHISNASSRTSCGESQDLSVGQLTTCEDQTAVYSYSDGPTSQHVSIPALALPIATDSNEYEQPRLRSISSLNIELSSSEPTGLALHTRASRDSLRTTSPVSTLYGYNSSNSRASRRPHTMLPSRLMTSGFATSWNMPQTSASRNNSLNGQQAAEPDQFPEHHGSTSSLTSMTPY